MRLIPFLTAAQTQQGITGDVQGDIPHQAGNIKFGAGLHGVDVFGDDFMHHLGAVMQGRPG